MTKHLITLINHPGLKVMKGLQLQSPSPSIGLAYIGAFLKKRGLDYTAIDACGSALSNIRPYRGRKDIYIQGLSAEETFSRIPAETRIVGMTCLFSHCWPLVMEIAQLVRIRLPNVLLVAGGEHPTALPESALISGTFDAVVCGEGEETFLELVQKVLADQEWRTTSGIAFLERDKIVKTGVRKRVAAIDEFPRPDWDSWCIENYISMRQVTGIDLGRQMPILGSRGCPFACTFCSNENMWGRKYIMRSPKLLVDEMEDFKRKYDVQGFTFMDSTFVVDRRKTLEFANELIHRRLEITYQLPAGTRCEAFDSELAAALDRSGLKNFAFAPESASEPILKRIRKQIRISRLIDALRVVLKTRMTVGCFFVIGFPEDTKESLKETLRFIRRLALMGVHDLTVSQFTPYPGSDYFDELRKAGKISEGMSELNDLVNFYASKSKTYCESLTSRQLFRWMIWMYLNFYVLSFAVRPIRLLKNFLDFFTKGVENTRYMRLFREYFFRRKKWRAIQNEKGFESANAEPLISNQATSRS